jgi:hypothetical protein
MPSNKVLVLLLVGILIFIAWLDYEKGPPEFTGTSVREYRLMNDDDQKLVILEARRTLFHKYLNKSEVIRADCVAGLFDANTEQGKSQMGMLQKHLESETGHDKDLSAEEITINIINTKFCPN